MGRGMTLLGVPVMGGGVHEIDITLAAGAISPVSTELLINGDMELTTDWTSNGIPSTNERSNTQAHGGTYSRHLVSAGSYAGLLQNVTMSTTTWYTATSWVYVVSGGVQVSYNNNTYAIITTTGEWINAFTTRRRSGTIVKFMAIDNNGAAEYYVDDCSLVEYTFASLLLYLGDVKRLTGSFICHPSTPTKTACGLVFNYADSANMLHVYVDRTANRVYLDKCVAGTWSNVLWGAVTYVEGAELKDVVAGTNHSVYYNDAQVGSTTAVADAGLGSKVYAFATSALSGVGAVQTFQ